MTPDPETFGWSHFATIAALTMSLIGVGVAMWSNRKSDTSERRRVEQSDGCKYDHDGLRGILVAQGAALTEMVKQQAQAVKAFSELAHGLAMNHRDILDHHKEVSRVLGDISKKLERPQ
jgi:hypothetical protein